MTFSVDETDSSRDLQPTRVACKTWRQPATAPAARQPRQKSSDPASTIHFQIARTEEERLSANRLVYQQYLTTGLIRPNPYQAHVTPAHLSDDTTVIVGQSHGRVICTVTLIGDSSNGLPMEAIYAQEIAARRQALLALAEVSCLAIGDVPQRQFLTALIGMTRLMAQYARHRDIDQLVIAAHPKHARFYERFMGFQRFGGLTTYPRFRHHPAVASCLDFETIDRNRPKCWDQYFLDPIPDYQLRHRMISDSERATYQQLLELTQMQEERTPAI